MLDYAKTTPAGGAQSGMDMSTTPDPVEVGRKANELAAEMGLGAHRHARQQAKEAEQAGDSKAALFWTAVAEALSPHCSI